MTSPVRELKCATIPDVVQHSDEEVIASELMAKSLGVEVRCTDTGAMTGMWDFEFTLPDGTEGAGEMTTITDPASREWRSLNAKAPHINGTNRAWLVSPRQSSPKMESVLKHLRRAVPLADAREERDFENLFHDPTLAGDPSLKWLRENQLDVYGFKSEKSPGRVFFEDAMLAAFVPDNLDAVLGCIELKLQDPRFENRFDKLARSGRPEQHLVVRVDSSGIPPGDWLALTSRESTLPSRPPAISGRHITGLWLLPEFPGCIVWWTFATGWHRSPV